MIRSQAATTAVAVDIRGARGTNAAIINGIYEPTDEISSGWPIYRKRGDAGKWLEYFVAANKWYIKATTDKGRAKVWLRLGSDPPTRPEPPTTKTLSEDTRGSKQRKEKSKKLFVVINDFIFQCNFFNLILYSIVNNFLLFVVFAIVDSFKFWKLSSDCEDHYRWRHRSVRRRTILARLIDHRCVCRTTTKGSSSKFLQSSRS